MAVIENLPSPSNERPIGFGRLKRKEDARFIRGQGTYLDDIKLPGMVYGAVLRSPYAHARIVSIDTSEAICPAWANSSSEDCSPSADGRGPVDYKRHLAGVLTVRALRRAADRAGGRDRKKART